jgi:uncharacterized protein YacL
MVSCENGVNNTVVLLVIILALIFIGTIDSIYDVMMGLQITNTPYYDKDSQEESKIFQKMWFFYIFGIVAYGVKTYMELTGKECSLYTTVALVTAIASVFMGVIMSTFVYSGMQQARERNNRVILSLFALAIILMFFFYEESIKNLVEM